MSISLRIGLLLASLMVFILIIVTVIKKRLNIKYSIVWLLWALLALFMAIYPTSFYFLASVLGIELPVNAVFLVMIGLLYALTFYVYCMISKHNEEIISLTYEISALKKELEDLKKKHNEK
ncbi:MAG: DUF2304 domain-containing protein [Erysipelotrichaceae bacterium]|nr:DUF2304 domain-containing protein [Erysipelotrichaceae bacterium]